MDKKFLKMAFAILTVVFAVTFISCSKDKNDEPDPPKPSETETGTGSDTDLNGHDYVDLGLPSGIKWATCNVGATKPEEYGDFFAWGETKPKALYLMDNSATKDKTIEWLRTNGYIDSKGNLTLAHDAAHANWGGSWRMPTKSEIEELAENTICSWVPGYGIELTSLKNWKKLFIPAAGYRYADNHFGAGACGYYSSSTPSYDDKPGYSNAYTLVFNTDRLDWFYLSRSDGYTIRPVTK